MSMNFRFITRLAVSRLPPKTRQASHVMLYSELRESVYFSPNKNYPSQTALLVMRSDGKLGFPWMVQNGEKSFEEIMNNGLSEMFHLDKDRVHIEEKDYHQSHYSEGRNICFHFYIKKIKEKVLQDIEIGFAKSNDRKMVLGLCRCPLYILGDGSSGLPAFLNNNFIGNSRELLIDGITGHKLLSKPQMEEILRRCEFSEINSIID